MSAPSTAHDVHAVVLVEALVLDRDERLRHVRGQRRERDARAPLATDLADERAVAGDTRATTAASVMICQASPVDLRAVS